jgi:hypothetical protein
MKVKEYVASMYTKRNTRKQLHGRLRADWQALLGLMNRQERSAQKPTRWVNWFQS